MLYLYSKKKRKIISGSLDNTLKLWEPESKKYINSFEEHRLRINDIAVSPDENFFISAGDDKTIKLWNIEESRSLMTLEGHEEKINSIDISSEGRFIVSAGSDKTVRLWSAKTGECLKILKGYGAEITCVKFSPDCRYIISSGKDNLVKIWEVDWEWDFSEEKEILPSDEIQTEEAFNENKFFIEEKKDGPKAEYKVEKKLLLKRKRQKILKSKATLIEQETQ